MILSIMQIIHIFLGILLELVIESDLHCPDDPLQYTRVVIFRKIATRSRGFNDIYCMQHISQLLLFSK